MRRWRAATSGGSTLGTRSAKSRDRRLHDPAHARRRASASASRRRARGAARIAGRRRPPSSSISGWTMRRGPVPSGASTRAVHHESLPLAEAALNQLDLVEPHEHQERVGVAQPDLEHLPAAARARLLHRGDRRRCRRLLAGPQRAQRRDARAGPRSGTAGARGGPRPCAGRSARAPRRASGRPRRWSWPASRAPRAAPGARRSRGVYAVHSLVARRPRRRRGRSAVRAAEEGLALAGRSPAARARIAASSSSSAPTAGRGGARARCTRSASAASGSRVCSTRRKPSAARYSSGGAEAPAGGLRAAPRRGSRPMVLLQRLTRNAPSA
jgi:hypothetical protein